MTCPECGEQAKFVSYRSCEVMTLMGPAVYERAYYYCPHCHQGHCPTDDEFGLADKHTPGSEEVIALAGATSAFDEAAHVKLARMSGLTLSSSSVQRITERVGDEVARRRTAGETFGPDEVWTWPVDANGLTTAVCASEKSVAGVLLPPLPTGGVTFCEDMAVGRGPG